MLIRFSVQNWMSFKEKTELSMVATREKQHSEKGRFHEIEHYGIKLLPVASLYGGNASGKTNFFKAIGFAKKFIVEGTRPDEMINVTPFLLDHESKEENTSFYFEISVDGIIFEYMFSINKKKVLEEKLIHITKTNEKILFHRLKEKVTIGASLKKEKNDLLVIAKGTRDNILFITNAFSQKNMTFSPIYDWFRYTLNLIAPDQRFGAFLHFFNQNSDQLNSLLSLFDTGMIHLEESSIEWDMVPIAPYVKEDIEKRLKEGSEVYIDTPKERYKVARRQGKLEVKKLISYHKHNNKESLVPFEMDQESDGSRRVIELLPALIDLMNNNKVYIIDELDRSLHPLLVEKILEFYLKNDHNVSSQLLFTTHNLHLMDQAIFRRDEIWIVERTPLGQSHMIPLSDYKEIRYDKNIQKSYIHGRFGGIPKITLP